MIQEIEPASNPGRFRSSKNTGPVISASNTERIFEPFQRLNERASHDGFGLGLTIVASIAEAHGGTATAHPRDEAALA
jgi:signal transduction histidine kinase